MSGLNSKDLTVCLNSKIVVTKTKLYVRRARSYGLWHAHDIQEIG